MPRVDAVTALASENSDTCRSGRVSLRRGAVSDELCVHLDSRDPDLGEPVAQHECAHRQVRVAGSQRAFKRGHAGERQARGSSIRAAEDAEAAGAARSVPDGDKHDWMGWFHSDDSCCSLDRPEPG